MAYIKNKMLYVLADDGINYIEYKTVDNEIFLTADPIEDRFSFEDYQSAIRARISKHVIRLYLLNDDETIKRDVSEYFISGSVDLNYQQGQTRSFNVTLSNLNGEWIPNPTNGWLWKGTKFRLDIGIFYNGTTYWKKCGIFTPNDPTLNNSGSNKTISMQMYDKFSLLDGTLNGKTDIAFTIPIGTKIREAIRICLASDKGNGRQYDYKPLIFPSFREDVVTSSTITKTPNSNVGEIITDLANMISCDVCYNDAGNLTLTSGIDDVFMENRPILWNYSAKELLYTDPSLTVDFSKIVNRVTVKGQIVNGYQYKGVSINTNPNSQSNIYMTDANPLYIEDKNINSDPLCVDRAKYELTKQGKLGFRVNYKSIFIPHLEPNGMVMWGNDDYNMKNEKLIMPSLHLELGSYITMDVTASNVKELALMS